MTLEGFLDGLQTLLALDLQEVSASGAMSEHDLARWNSFRADPARWLVRADEETARALWLAMERHKSRPNRTIGAPASELNVIQFIPGKATCR